MRLDKFLGDCNICTRKEAAKAVSAGKVAVNGSVARDRAAQIDPERDIVTFAGKAVKYEKFVYIMMNKPEGVVSASEDRGTTVIDLLPEDVRRDGLFPCGRLDKYTVGLMLITDDGETGHYLLSPKRHVGKEYRFEVRDPLTSSDVERLEKGVDIGGYVTKPAKLTMSGERVGRICISEGKYHQIRLMMNAVGNEITFLERTRFGSLSLDGTLSRGEWRKLTESEIEALKKDAGMY